MTPHEESRTCVPHAVLDCQECTELVVDAEVATFRTVPPWTRMPCDECGQDHQASRSRPRTKGRFICGQCEARERGAAAVDTISNAEGGEQPATEHPSGNADETSFVASAKLEPEAAPSAEETPSVPPELQLAELEALVRSIDDIDDDPQRWADLHEPVLNAAYAWRDEQTRDYSSRALTTVPWMSLFFELRRFRRVLVAQAVAAAAWKHHRNLAGLVELLRESREFVLRASSAAKNRKDRDYGTEFMQRLDAAIEECNP